MIGYHCWLVNPEWAKYITTALVSTGTYVGGIFTGLFIKSLEEWWKTRVERRRLRKALYHELGENLRYMYWILFSLVQEPSEFAPPAWTGPLKFEECERREVYDHALVSQSILFREIKEANHISEFYLALNRLKTESPEHQIQGIRYTYDNISRLISKGQLSRRLLEKARPGVGINGLYPWAVRKALLYEKLSHRNVPKDGKPRAWDASPTLLKKAKALWRGIPGDEIPVRPGPSPVGKRIL
jgi:hypothetical protein